MFAQVQSLGVFALRGFSVTVEADLSRGLPQFELVGLPDSAVKESRDRVRSAIKNLGFEFPVSRITLNLAPADVRKTGPVYDLPVLLGILCASGQLAALPDDSAFVGELSLDGQIRPVQGVLSMALAAQKQGIRRLYLPAANAAEAAEACGGAGMQVYPARCVTDVVEALAGRAPIRPDDR